MNRERYTDAFKEQVAKDRRENGMLGKEVAEKYGIAESTVYTWTTQYYSSNRDSKGRFKPVEYSEITKACAISDYLNGVPQKEILQKYKIPSSALCRWMQEHWKENCIEETKTTSIFRERHYRAGKEACLERFIRLPHPLM